MVDPRRYYATPIVQREIAEFLMGRWAGVEGYSRKWVRWEADRPLIINSPSKVYDVIIKNSFISPRSFYGTIEVFKKLSSREDVEENYVSNVLCVTPFIDIDVVDEEKFMNTWIYVVEIARTITNYLCNEHSVCESVYILWSGLGAHVRVHEKAFEESLKYKHPIQLTYIVVEYILRSIRKKILEIIGKAKGNVKVENLIAPKRVFTAPLSLHRRLDRVAITFKPEKLEEFKPAWFNPEKPVHDPNAWRRYRVREADDLAFKALKEIGGIVERTVIEFLGGKESTKTEKPVEKLEEPVEPGRFPVMALLQAVRYYLLTGDLERAKSWGLNRAIFYAWAKYYGPSKQSLIKARVKKYSVRPREVDPSEVEWEEVGGEKAQVSRRGWYVMGGIEQLPEDFDRYVTRKFEEAGISFKEAWEKALEYVKKFPRGVLANPQEFYKEVYEPVRDKFVEKVLMRKHSGGSIDLTKWIKKSKNKNN